MVTGKEGCTQKLNFLRLFEKKLIQDASRCWAHGKTSYEQKKANLFEIGSHEMISAQSPESGIPYGALFSAWSHVPRSVPHLSR